MSNNNRGRKTLRPTSSTRRPQGHPVQTQNTESDIRDWGDSIHSRQPQYLCIGVLNIGWPPLPTKTPHPKQNALHQLLHRSQTDILGILEVGLNWTLIPKAHSWYERTHAVFRQQ